MYDLCRKLCSGQSRAFPSVLAEKLLSPISESETYKKTRSVFRENDRWAWVYSSAVPYLDVTVKSIGYGLGRLSLVSDPSTSARSSLASTTRLHLRSHDITDRVSITVREYVQILKEAPNLAWLVLTDVLVKSDKKEVRIVMKNFKPRTIEVLSLSTDDLYILGNEDAEYDDDTSALFSLFAPFSKISHFHLDVDNARSDIPRDVKIMGWHLPVTCGALFMENVRNHILSQTEHQVTTLNFIRIARRSDSDEEPINIQETFYDAQFDGDSDQVSVVNEKSGSDDELDRGTVKAMKDLLCAASPNLTYLGVDPRILALEGMDAEADPELLSKLDLRSLKRVAFHLPFYEGAIPLTLPDKDLGKLGRYPKEFRRLHDPWGLATKVLEYFHTTSAPSNIVEVTACLHGSLPYPQTDTPPSDSDWWKAGRYDRLTTFQERAAALLDVSINHSKKHTATIHETKRITMDMSQLSGLDQEMPLDFLFNISSWASTYLFSGTLCQRVWVGPRALTSLENGNVAGLRGGRDIRLYLSLHYPSSEDAAFSENFGIAMHHSEGAGDVQWDHPAGVCPRWCAPLWWVVDGNM